MNQQNHQNRKIMHIKDLKDIYLQQQQMRNQILQLHNALGACQNKWSKIVRNLIRENVQLKYQNQTLKKQLKTKKFSHVSKKPSLAVENETIYKFGTQSTYSCQELQENQKQKYQIQQNNQLKELYNA